MVRKVDLKELLLLAVITFLAGYALLQLFGYHAEALEVYYLEEMFWPGALRLLQSWFIDGWFPIFPWLGYAFLGAAFFKYLASRDGRIPVTNTLVWGLVLTALGFVLLFIPVEGIENFASGEIIHNRGGYSEIFYPPTPGYIILSLGIFLLFVRVIYRMQTNPLGDIVSFFGKYSMLVYLAHQIMGYLLLGPIIEAFGVDAISVGWFFTFANLMIIALVYLVCLLAGAFKQQYKFDNSFLHVIIGK